MRRWRSPIGKALPRAAARRKKRGKLLGLGLANYVESSIGAPKRAGADQGQARTGRVDVVIGTQPSGQGHETSFAQVVSDLLGVPVERVDIILGDTDVVRVGGGSHSGRSMRHAATVFSKARSRSDRERQAHRRRDHRNAARPRHVQRRPVRRARNQPHLRHARTRARGRARRTAGRSRRTGSRSLPTTRCTSRCFPTAARSARSRSIRTPARW